MVEQKRNVMAHAQKPDLVFQRNGRVHLYRLGCQFSRLLAAEVCGSAVVMLDRPCPIRCTTAGYPLHSPFSPSLLHPCVSVCHHIPFLLYYIDCIRLLYLLSLLLGLYISGAWRLFLSLSSSLLLLFLLSLYAAAASNVAVFKIFFLNTFYVSCVRI